MTYAEVLEEAWENVYTRYEPHEEVGDEFAYLEEHLLSFKLVLYGYG